MRNNIVFFRNHYEAIENLETPEERADAYRTLFEYAFNQIEVEDANPLSKAIMMISKPVFDKQNEISKKRSEAGKKGGEISKRKQTISKNKQTVSKSNQDKDKDKDKDKKNNTPYNPPKGGFAGLVDSYTDNQELRVELNEYVKMRKKLKKGFTEHALELKFKKLDSLSTDDRAKIEIVKQATMNGWQDFYPLKNDYQSDWYGNKETEKADDDLIQQALEMQRKRKEDSA